MATALLVILAAVVLGGSSGGLFRRRLGSGRTSVREYQQALDTLRHMSARRAATDGVTPLPAVSHNGIGAVSPDSASPPKRGRARTSSRTGTQAASRNGTGAASGNGAGATSGNGRRSRSRSASSGRRTEVLASTAGDGSAGGRRAATAAFRSSGAPVTTRVDAPVREVAQAEPTVADAPSTAVEPVRDGATVELRPVRTAADTVHELAAARALHGNRPARPSMPSKRKAGPNRTTVLTVAAAVAIALVTAVAVALGPSHHSTTTGSASHPAPAPTAAVRHSASRAAKPRTSTAAGSSSSLTAISTSGSAATYRVGSPTFTLALAADGACWVQATNPSSGQVVWTGTLQAGQSQQVPASGQLVVRLGDAHNVTLTVGGRQVVLPPGFDSVVDLTFQTA